MVLFYIKNTTINSNTYITHANANISSCETPLPTIKRKDVLQIKILSQSDSKIICDLSPIFFSHAQVLIIHVYTCT